MPKYTYLFWLTDGQKFSKTFIELETFDNAQDYYKGSVVVFFGELWKIVEIRDTYLNYHENSYETDIIIEKA